MKFSDLILHTKSRTNLENYLKKPMHALLLVGENGVGLRTIAKSLAQEIAKANMIIIEPKLHNQQKTANINIDDIRDLHEITRARRDKNFVILIDDVDKMTNDAPQAFLKLLEEPTANIFYILTSHNAKRLPETIRSRTQIIEILPPPKTAVQEIFKVSPTKLMAEKRAQIEFLGERKPAEIVRLLTDEQYFRDKAAVMNTAKKFIQGSVAEKLKIVVATTARETAIELAQNIAKLLILTAPKSKNPKMIAESLSILTKTIENLTQNGHVKTQLLNLALNI